MNRNSLMNCIKQDLIFQKMLRHLEVSFNCHTIILYGSRARGVGVTDSSDYDILAIRETGENIREANEYDGKFIDAWIYSESILNEVDSSLIRIKDGLIIKQKRHFGTNLLKKVKEIFDEGPSPIPQWEAVLIVSWLQKMYKRSQLEDIEGNFRRHWLLFDCLESYFKLRGLWYFGPKESFKWLITNDKKVYLAFEKALEMHASLEDIQNLVENVISY